MSEIKSLDRALRALDLFLGDPDAARSVTELGEYLAVNKSSASRMARTLASRGYLERDPHSRGYRLGPKLRLRMAARHAPTLRDLARPFIFPLMKATGECSHTAVPSQGQALIIDDVESAESLRVAAGIGRLNLSHCTAVGKSLLAFGALDFPTELPSRMPRTIVDPDALEAHLGEIRALGYAFDDEENEPGVRCIAAPVRGADGTVIASIGISGPTVRMTDARIGELGQVVVDAARELSLVLGYRVSRELPRNAAALAARGASEAV